MATLQAIVFSYLVLTFISRLIYADSPCGDWEPYKKEKCLKIFEELSLETYKDAENYCRTEQEANLISIGLEEKQIFISEFLKNKQIVDNVWIGLVYLNNTYQWSDGANFYYSNWAEGSPKNSTDDCVQIETGDTTFGKWSDVLCTKKNLVICEKLQLWTLADLQTKVVDLEYNFDVSKAEISELQSSVKKLKDEVADLSSELQSSVKKLTDEVADLSKNKVPIGFIYVQVPNQKSPSEIWPSMTWEDISSNYAGLFFRVLGGGSASFGSQQSDNSPRLVSMQADYGTSVKPGGSDTVNISPNDQWSDFVHLWGDDWGQKLRVKVSGGEVRPKNTAVKVWRRKS